jgi:hypothetical protein
VLAKAQEYSLVDQARIVSAVAVVHNFICIHDPKDNESVEARIESVTGTGATLDCEEVWGRCRLVRRGIGQYSRCTPERERQGLDCETRRLDLVS